MNTIYIKTQDLTISNWSKGETREYYIYPETANYQNKDFIFRISSASINEVPAEFTNFNNYTRYLAMLDQPLSLKINNKEVKDNELILVKFQSDDNVISYSRGNDFNLMINNDKAIGNVVKGLFLTSDADFITIFSLHDGCVVNQTSILNLYECLIIKNNKEINIECSKECFISEIKLKSR